MWKNLLWKGLEYHSMENCMVHAAVNGTDIYSTIIGTYNNVIYKVDYQIIINQFWATTFFEIKTRLDNSVQHISFQSDGKGNWSTDGKPQEKFDGCIDIDISLTPFTNTLLVNRLNLSEGEDKLITVLYIDILDGQITPVSQRYTRLSRKKYKYQNVPNDFESVISVDESGLVEDYPDLFKRIAVREGN